jgi:cytochrome P450
MIDIVRDSQSYSVPPTVPLSWLARLKALQTFHTGAETIRDAGGPVTLIKLGPRRVTPTFAMVTSPQGARDVLGGTDDAIDKEMIVHVQSRLFGANVFNMPYAAWKPRRRTLQPLFTKKHVATFSGHMSEAAEALARKWAQGGTVDLDHEIRRLTLRVIGRSVFDVDFGVNADIGPATECVLSYVTQRSLHPVRAPIWLPTIARRRFRRAMAVLHGVIDDAIAACRANPDSGAELIRLLLEARDPETGEPLDAAAIRDELLVFLLAGHDTTSTTLTYALWALGRHPDMQAKVADEAWSAAPDRAISVDDVPNLPYTTQVLHEALRLCPPAPAIGRMAIRDLVVDGYRIPAGTNVIVGAYAIHRDPALWEQPTLFDPDRFSPERSRGRNRWQFIPFGGGPRSCIGDHFAMLEAILGLATLARSAAITSLEAEFPVALPFTMTAGAPIPARVSARTREMTPAD